MLIVVYEEESNWVVGSLSIADTMLVLLPWLQLWLKTYHRATMAYYLFKIQDTWLPDQTSYVLLLHDYDYYENELRCCLSLLWSVVIVFFSLCVLKKH